MRVRVSGSFQEIVGLGNLRCVGRLDAQATILSSSVHVTLIPANRSRGISDRLRISLMLTTAWPRLEPFDLLTELPTSNRRPIRSRLSIRIEAILPVMLARYSLRSARTLNGLRNGATAVTKVGHTVPSLCRGIRTRDSEHTTTTASIASRNSETI